jgi:uncharacterized protein YndB with AHSA1/START domain
MIPSQIEKEVVIDAPLDVVWRVITEPDQIKQWFHSEVAELDLRTGGSGYLSWTDGAGYNLKVEAVDPMRRFAFRWMRPEGAPPDASNSMLVEFTLRSEGGRTHLKVVESGFDTIDWSKAEKASYAEEHTAGWDACLAGIAELSLRKAGVPKTGR